MPTLNGKAFTIERGWYTSEGLRIAATVMRPHGTGRFPVVVWNHNSRIRLVGDVVEDETAKPTVPDGAAAFPGVTDKGWMWFFPEGRGYAGSDGASPVSLVSAGPHAVVEYLRKRADDTLAGFDWLAGRPDVDTSRVVMAGASHGGVATLLAAAKRPDLARAVVVQAAGVWPGMVTPGLEQMRLAVGSIGAPILFQHFRNDPIVPIEVSRVLAATPLAAGAGRPRLVEYDGVEDVNGHFQFLPGNYERMLPDLMGALAAALDPQPDSGHREPAKRARA